MVEPPCATWWLALPRRHGAHPGNIWGYGLRRVYGINGDILGYTGWPSLAAMGLTPGIYGDIRAQPDIRDKRGAYGMRIYGDIPDSPP